MIQVKTELNVSATQSQQAIKTINSIGPGLWRITTLIQGNVFYSSQASQSGQVRVNIGDFESIIQQIPPGTDPLNSQYEVPPAYYSKFNFAEIVNLTEDNLTVKLGITPEDGFEMSAGATFYICAEKIG